MKKVISILLSILLLLGSFSNFALANEDKNEWAVVKVSNGKETNNYDAISKNGDFYFAAEDFGEFTKYNFVKGDKYGYELGSKTIIIDPKTGDMQIPIQNYISTIGAPIYVDGKYYFSASELLPWMNVECNVDGAILYVIPDEVSLWEVIEDFNYNDYMFNLYEEYGDSASSITSLTAMMIFDGFLNLRIDRLIPIGESKSLYDFECYVAALAEMGQDGINYNERLVETVQSLDEFEEVFGFTSEELNGNWGESLQKIGLNDSVIKSIQELSEEWNEILKCASIPAKLTEYYDVFAAYKTYELILETDNEYREYLAWLSDRGTDDNVFDTALEKAQITLDKNRGVIYTLRTEFTKSVLENVPGALFEAIANNAMDESIIQTFSQAVAAADVIGSLSAYTTVAKVIYSYLAPNVVEGYEGMAKVDVLEAIQDYCWGLAGSLQYEEMTEENIMHIRQSYLTALRTSKKLFEYQKQIFESNALKVFNEVYDGSGLLDDKIKKIEEKIKQVVVSSDATANDSVGQKEDIKKMLENLECSKEEFVEILIEWDGKYVGTDELINLTLELRTEYRNSSSLNWEGSSAYTDDGELVCTYEKEVSEEKGKIKIALFDMENVYYLEGNDGNYSPETLTNDISVVEATAKIKGLDGKEYTMHSEEGLMRSYTGFWFWGVCNINQGRVVEYDSSWIQDVYAQYDEEDGWKIEEEYDDENDKFLETEEIIRYGTEYASYAQPSLRIAYELEGIVRDEWGRQGILGTSPNHFNHQGYIYVSDFKEELEFSAICCCPEADFLESKGTFGIRIGWSRNTEEIRNIFLEFNDDFVDVDELMYEVFHNSDIEGLGTVYDELCDANIIEIEDYSVRIVGNVVALKFKNGWNNGFYNIEFHPYDVYAEDGKLYYSNGEEIEIDYNLAYNLYGWPVSQ